MPMSLAFYILSLPLFLVAICCIVSLAYFRCGIVVDVAMVSNCLDLMLQSLLRCYLKKMWSNPIQKHLGVPH